MLNDYYISASPAAAFSLESNVIDWIRPQVCISAAENAADSCVKEDDIRKEFDRILKDNKIDRLEAPLFFQIAEAIARLGGTPAILDEEEAKTRLDSFKFEGNELLKVFQPDSARRELFWGYLAETERMVNATIELVEKIEKRLMEKETSYLNFISAKNLLGLSCYLSDESAFLSPLEFTGAQFNLAPFSSIEFTGVRRVLQRLRTIKTGMGIFKDYYKRGIIYDRDEFVRAFLESPFNSYARLSEFFSGSFSKSALGRVPQYHLDFVAGMTRMAMSEKAFELADLFQEEAFLKTGDKYDREYISKPLPSPLLRFIDGTFGDIADCGVSLDSLLAIATAGVLGRVVAGYAKGAAFLEKAGKAIGPAKYMLPGAAILVSKAGENMIGLRGLKFLGNIVFEFMKGGAYLYAGQAVDEEDGAHFGGLVYLFGLGARTSYVTGRATRLVKGLLNGERESSVVGFVEATAEMSNAELMFTARALANRSIAKVHPEELAEKVFEMRKGIERIAELRARIHQEVQVSIRFAAKNEEVVSKDFLNRVYKLAGEATPKTDRPRLREIIKGIARIISKERARVADLNKPQFVSPDGRRVSWSRIFGRGSKSGGSGGGTKWKVPLQANGGGGAREGVVVQPAAGFRETILANPPEMFDLDALIQFTDGSVVMGSDELLVAIQRVYQADPGMRGTLWRRLSELIKGGRYGRGWKKIPISADQRWRGRVGEYRVFVTYDRGTQKYTIVDFDYRGKINYSRP